MSTYRVRHQRIRFGAVTWHTYGPFRFYLVAYVVALWHLGEWDAATVEVRK